MKKNRKERLKELRLQKFYIGNPWEKQVWETSLSYAVFCVFRDLGPTRTVSNAVKHFTEQVGRSVLPKNVQSWANTYYWHERAEAYDAYIDAIKREEREEKIREMVERHANIAMKALDKVAKRLDSLEPEKITPMTLVKLFDVSTKVERLSRGEPAEEENREVVIKIHGPNQS